MANNITEEHKMKGFNEILRSMARLIYNANNIIIMSGAGISTKANIPDFRSTDLGLYDQYRISNNQFDPQALFSLDFFVKNPKPFYNIIFELFPAIQNAKPTLTHHFIQIINKYGKLLRHYTQNVDGLDKLTGLSENKIIEAHGHLKSGSCISCRRQYEIEYLKKEISQKKIPYCDECESVLKPDVVLFGEPFKINFQNIDDWKKCDLLIVLGTSLAVQPFASLINQVTRECPRIFINKTSYSSNQLQKVNDLFVLGECDEICLKLAKLLGFENDLVNDFNISNGKKKIEIQTQFLNENFFSSNKNSESSTSNISNDSSSNIKPNKKIQKLNSNESNEENYTQTNQVDYNRTEFNHLNTNFNSTLSLKQNKETSSDKQSQNQEQQSNNNFYYSKQNKLKSLDSSFSEQKYTEFSPSLTHQLVNFNNNNNNINIRPKTKISRRSTFK